VIYVCIPARDEEQTLGVLLWKIRKVMAEFDRDYRILVLDDASADHTPAVLQRYVKVLPLVRIRTDQPIGYARAVERLLKEAVGQSDYPKRDAVVTLQGDFTEDPADIVSLIKALEGGADIVAASVEDERKELPSQIRWARRLAPWVLGRSFRGAPISDPLTGFRAYRVIVLKKMLREVGERPLLTAEGWAANVELLGLAASHARRVVEEPLHLRYHLLARPSRFKATRALKDLFKVRGIRWPAAQQEPPAADPVPTASAAAAGAAAVPKGVR
jgi:glycosyltransferase involved in cell wall biosynthesis